MTQTLSRNIHQFNQMVEERKDIQVTENCSRCEGLLVDDRCYDPQTGGVIRIAIKRCVQCGDVTDPVILEHRMSNSESVRTERPCQRRLPMLRILAPA